LNLTVLIGGAEERAENPFPIHTVTKPSSVISSPHHVSKKNFSSPLFLEHVLISHWIAARSSAPAISTIKSNSPHAAKTPNHYIFTLKMTATMFDETLDNSQHSTQLIPES
jgi:hypothetical protein